MVRRLEQTRTRMRRKARSEDWKYLGYSCVGPTHLGAPPSIRIEELAPIPPQQGGAKRQGNVELGLRRRVGHRPIRARVPLVRFEETASGTAAGKPEKDPDPKAGRRRAREHGEWEDDL